MQTLLWVLRCTSSLSIIGSSLIIYMILSDRKQKLKFPHNRIVLAMSILDILQSVAVGLATAPAPQTSGIPGALGTEATCAAQAFFVQMGFAVPLYNASLSLYYLLRIRNVKRQKFVRQIEPFLHGVSLLYPLGTGIVGIYLHLFETVGSVESTAMFCWIDLFDPDKCCLVFVFAGAAVSITWFLSVYSIISSYCAVRKKHINMLIYESISRNRQNERVTRMNHERYEVVKQLVFYFVGFSITYFWFVIKTVFIWLRIKPPTIMFILAGVFTPMQGLWNLVAYSLPVFYHLRAIRPEKSFGWAVWRTVFFQSIDVTDGECPDGATQNAYPTCDIMTDGWSVEGHDNEADNNGHGNATNDKSYSSRSKESRASSRSDFTIPRINTRRKREKKEKKEKNPCDLDPCSSLWMFPSMSVDSDMSDDTYYDSDAKSCSSNV